LIRLCGQLSALVYPFMDLVLMVIFLFNRFCDFRPSRPSSRGPTGRKAIEALFA